MTTCYECGKGIKGEGILTNPPRWAMRMFGEFPKWYHKHCYTISELRAERELTGKGPSNEDLWNIGQQVKNYGK